MGGGGGTGDRGSDIKKTSSRENGRLVERHWRGAGEMAGRKMPKTAGTVGEGK